MQSGIPVRSRWEETLGLFKTAGAAATLAGVAGVVAKRLADRKQRGPAQGADSPGAPARQAATPAEADMAPGPAGTSIADEIEQLAAMRDHGILNEQEFAAAKGQTARSLSRRDPGPPLLEASANSEFTTGTCLARVAVAPPVAAPSANHRPVVA